MKQNKLIYWLVLLLVILNIGTLSFLWLGGPHHPPRDRPNGPGGLADFIKTELDFNSEQQMQFDSLVTMHRSEMRSIKDSIEYLKKEWYNQLKSGFDSASHESTLQKISFFEKKINIVIFNHLMSVKRICTVDQSIRFDHLIDDIIDKIGGFGPKRNENVPISEGSSPRNGGR